MRKFSHESFFFACPFSHTGFGKSGHLLRGGTVALLRRRCRIYANIYIRMINSLQKTVVPRKHGKDAMDTSGSLTGMFDEMNKWDIVPGKRDRG